MNSLTETERELVESYISDLFGLCFFHRFGKNGDLRPLVKTCFASFLMYLPDLVNKSPNGRVMQNVAYWNSRYHTSPIFTMEKLRCWGAQVKEVS
jgi:hypothetical protein